MLYGNVIFIKKSGGDGSKFPVTTTNLCIGRSDDCIIRIQNPLISPKHCQLTIDSDGQAKIKNLSNTNPTVLNDKQLGSGKHVLRQGDILKLGERFARWEYVPSSKYYPSAQSSEPLVAVVSHHPRNPEESVAETNQIIGDSAKKQNKRLTGSGRKSLGKSLQITPGSAKAITSKKQSILRRSLQLQKCGRSPQVKLRSSVSRSSASRTPKVDHVNKTPARKSRKWEVKSVSPPNKVASVKNGINRKSTPIKLPMAQMSGENVIKPGLKNASKAPNLLTIAELPLPNVQKISERNIFDDVSEKNNLSLLPKSPSKASKTPSKMGNSQKKSLPKSNQKKSLSRALKNLQSSFTVEENVEIPKDSVKFSPRRFLARKCVLQNEIMESDEVSNKDVTSEKLSDKSPSKRKSSVLNGSTISSDASDEVEAEKNISPKVEKSAVTSGRGKGTSQLKTSPVSSPNKVEMRSRGKKSIPSGVLDTPVGKENVKDTPRKMAVSSSTKLISTKKDHHHGVKRKLSALASAERAAKKLKSIAPVKPDKNKKAALLLLGKASRKLKVQQNNNHVIKQKIVTRTIKQFTENTEKPEISNLNEAKKVNTLEMEVVKSLDLSSKTSPTSTKRHSTPIGKSPTQLSKRSSSKEMVSDEDTKSEIRTPLQRNRKRISSISSVSESDSMEVLHGSTPSKYSGKKSVSFSSTNSSIEYNSPNLHHDVNHPVSKRLRSRSGGSSPELTELSPFALGLTPKRMDDAFKSPRQKGRRSFCVTTPQNNSSVSIIKSASTSKVNHKPVVSSDKDSDNFSYLNMTNDAIYDLNDIQTPNLTIDLFVSPLSHKNTPRHKTHSTTFKSCQEFLLGEEEKYQHPERSLGSESYDEIVDEDSFTRKKKSLRKSNLPSAKNSESEASPKNDLIAARNVRQSMKSAGRRKTPKKNLSQVKGIRRLTKSAGPLKTPKKTPKKDTTEVHSVLHYMEVAGIRKSQNNDISEVRVIRQLTKSTGIYNGPENDLTDVKDVPRLVKSAKRRKRPRNDLTDFRGVRRLMESPGRRKSPRNDLTDFRGVRRLMESPGRRKSPRNDLTDFRGVRRLMESPGRRKSPRNDLTDFRGVRRLMESPGRRKSPKNDLTDVRGVRRLMESPGRRKSPRNDLTDVRGVRRLMESAGRRKSPRNDLTDVRGVRRLMESPGRRKSPRNDLTDVRGVRRLMESPGRRKSPRNDLTDVTGVKQLLSSKSTKNDLSDVSGLDTLFKSPASQDLDEDHNLSGVRQLFSMDEINTDADKLGVDEPYMSSEKEKTPKRRTRNANTITPALTSERPLLRRATKAALKIVEESDRITTRARANSSSEVPADQQLKVTRRGRKINAKDEVKPVSKRTRTGSEREVKVTEEINKPLKNLIAEEVITVRRTRASSKLSSRKEAAKRPATPSKSPTPVKRTRKAPVKENVKESSTKTATVSNLKNGKTPESKSRSVRSTRKSTAGASPEIKKVTRSKKSIEEDSVSSRSLRQRAKTVKEPLVSPAVTRSIRQRKAKIVSPDQKKGAKSNPVKTRAKAK